MKVWHSHTIILLMLGGLAAGCGHGSQSRNGHSEEAQSIQSTNFEDQEVDQEAEMESWETRFRKNLQDVRAVRAELAVSVEKTYAARLLGSSTIIYRSGAKSPGSKGIKALQKLFADTSQGMGYRIQFEIWGYSRETAKGLDPHLFELRCRFIEEHLKKEVKRQNLGELEVSRHFGPLPQGQGNEAFLIIVGTLLPPNL